MPADLTDAKRAGSSQVDARYTMVPIPDPSVERLGTC